MTEMSRGGTSLRRTLLMWLLIPLLTLLLVSSVAIYKVTLSFSRIAYDRNLDESADDIALIILRNAATGPRSFVLSKNARELILQDKYDDVYYNIRDERGVLHGGDASLPAPPQDVLERDNPVAIFYDTEVKNKAVRVVTVPVVLGTPNNAHLMHIQVAETLHKRKTLAKKVLTLITVPQLFIIMLAASIIWYAVRRSLHPLIQLEASVTARSPLELKPMEMIGVPTETRPLIGAINGLLDRVIRVLNAQSRFVTDASHQLRTPLAGLKTHIALASRQKTLEAVQYSLAQLDVGVDKLIHLANQLLSLARNEPGADRALKLVALDLNALAQSVTAEWVKVALKHGIDLGFEGTLEPVWIDGDSLRLTELLNNLVDNALRYTSPVGGIVTVRVTHPGVLEVEDNGPGIPESDRVLIFERFYRLEENQVGGSGLGLAIVKEIAEIHQAKIILTSGASHCGSCFQLSFPPVIYG